VLCDEPMMVRVSEQSIELYLKDLDFLSRNAPTQPRRDKIAQNDSPPCVALALVEALDPGRKYCLRRLALGRSELVDAGKDGSDEGPLDSWLRCLEPPSAIGSVPGEDPRGARL
jgi:hypothetical protein